MCKLTDKIQNISYCNLFLVVLSVFTIAFIAYLSYAHKISIESQQQIKECYNTHLQKADSLYCNLATYNKNATLAYQNVNNAILADSIIKETLKNTNQLSDAQVESIKLIISTHFHNIELLHKKYGEKLSMDSLRLCTERELLEGQTKAMIDLHLDKIEHEYSNITMWGAILTILFLVFSFYSLYKIDELIKQGQEGVVKINEMKAEGEKVITRFKEEKQGVVTKIQEQLKEIITAGNKTQQEISKQYKNAIKSTKLDLTAKSENIVVDFEKQLSDITENYKNISESRQKEFDDLIVKVQQILTELEEKRIRRTQKNKNKKNSKNENNG